MKEHEPFYQVRFVPDKNNSFKVIPPDSKYPYEKAWADLTFHFQEDPTLRERVFFLKEGDPIPPLKIRS